MRQTRWPNRIRTVRARRTCDLVVCLLLLTFLRIFTLDFSRCCHPGLLEAMEQQQVSIAKAGVVATLPARCSVIAAANPKHGSYNMSQTVAENLTLSKPILSRFDLVFILRDRADKAQDQLVSSNIINLYRNRKSHPPGSGTSSCPSASAAPPPTRFSPVFEEVGAARPDSENRLSLSQRLAWVHEFQTEPLPASLLRDYIAYAREYCKPKLTPEAAVVLKEYYMQLRYGRFTSCHLTVCHPARLILTIPLPQVPARWSPPVRHGPHHHPPTGGADPFVPGSRQGLSARLRPEGGRP